MSDALAIVATCFSVVALVMSILAYRSGGLRVRVRVELLPPPASSTVRIVVRNFGAPVTVEHVLLKATGIDGAWLVPDGENPNLPVELPARMGQETFLVDGPDLLRWFPRHRRLLRDRPAGRLKVRGMVLLEGHHCRKSRNRVTVRWPVSSEFANA